VSDLNPATTGVLLRAREVAFTALDDLRPRLLATTGRVAVHPKHDGTPVTAIDHEADELLTSAITQAFPNHGVLSEEGDTVAPATDWTWIVDPIDGTSNFIAGLPYWCVSIALALDGVPLLGIIDAPGLDRRYVALRGRQSERDGQRLQVRDPVDPRDRRFAHVPVMLTTGTARRARRAGVRLNLRVMGSTALDLAIVAEGAAVASIAVRPRVWDVAAGAVVVEGAGGHLVTLGEPPLLPLRPGVDHRDLSVPIASAADRGYVTDLATALLPKD
jgi:myo-inositol-1(or 4)-monophosphatase